MKTDLQLQDDVLAELDWEPAVQAAPIRVQAVHGVVSLRGELASPGEVWSAERATWRVAGVWAVRPQLTVRQAAGGLQSDGDIAHAVRNVLVWLVLPPAHAVRVAVLDGWVSLSGEVATAAQKQDMLQALGRLAGVQGITDAVQVLAGGAPTVPASPDQRPIEAAIRRRLAPASQPVQVLVQGSGVTLRGQVRSPAERALASHAAWGTPGVRVVHDHLQLIA